MPEGAFVAVSTDASDKLIRPRTLVGDPAAVPAPGAGLRWMPRRVALASGYRYVDPAAPPSAVALLDEDTDKPYELAIKSGVQQFRPMGTPADAQNVLTDEQRMRDAVRGGPRQRVSMNRDQPLTLDGTWQVIPFVQGGSQRDLNTFPPPSRFDYERRLIKPNPDVTVDQTYNLSLDLAVSSTQAGSYAKVSLRFLLPIPGNPTYAPLPDTLQRVDLPHEVDAVTSPVGLNFAYILSATSNMRRYGAQVQIKATMYQRTGTGLVGQLVGAALAPAGQTKPKLLDCVLNLWSTM